MAGLKKKNNYVYVRDEETGTVSRIDTKKDTKNAALAKAGIDSNKKKIVDESEFSNPSEETLKIRNAYDEKLKANQQPKQSFMEKQVARFTEKKPEENLTTQQASVAPQPIQPTPKTEATTTESPTPQPTTSSEEITQEQQQQAAEEFGVKDTDTEADALGKFTDKMVSSGMFSFDKNGKLVPTKAPYKPGWETFASLGSILLTTVGAMMGVPIPPINFSKLTGATGRREQQEAEWQKMQNDMAETYNKLQDIYARADVDEETASKAGKTAFAEAGQQAMMDKQLTNDLIRASDNLNSNLQMAGVNQANQKEIMKLLNDYDVNKQAAIMDATADWIKKNPKEAALMSGKDIINAVVSIAGAIK